VVVEATLPPAVGANGEDVESRMKYREEKSGPRPGNAANALMAVGRVDDGELILLLWT